MNTKSIHHVCIETHNYQKSIEFYTHILEFEVVKETPNFHGREFNTWLKLGSFMIELQTPKKEELNRGNNQGQGLKHICFVVEDIHREYERIKRLGYSDFKKKDGEEIYKVENGYLFKIKSPEGFEIEIRDNPEL